MRDYILGQVTPPKWVTSRPLGFPQSPPPPSPPCKKAVWCHDGNGNGKENVVKAKGWIGETTTLHLLFNTFLFIFCRHSTPTATWECLVLRLIEDLNKRLRFFFSLSERGFGSEGVNSWRDCFSCRLHLTKRGSWNDRDHWKYANSLSRDVFSFSLHFLVCKQQIWQRSPSRSIARENFLAPLQYSSIH